MLLLIDNYDSFTWNLVHYLGELGADVVVKRNDALQVQDVIAMAPEVIVLSPRSLRPSRRRDMPAPHQGRCLRRHPPSRRLPRPPDDWRGFRRQGRPLPRDRSRQDGHHAPFRKGRLSWPAVPRSRRRGIIPWSSKRKPFPPIWKSPPGWKTALSWGCGNRKHLIEGVQFHPESIASEHGHQLLRNFLEEAKSKVPA
jgi:anthranilate synthase component 2